MTTEEAKKLLDEYYQLRSTKQLYVCVAEQACIDAMTQTAETIAEQQREIERLTAIISRYVTHRGGCDARERISNGCTCGLDEVLK